MGKFVIYTGSLSLALAEEYGVYALYYPVRQKPFAQAATSPYPGSEQVEQRLACDAQIQVGSSLEVGVLQDGSRLHLAIVAQGGGY
jgi:hypothetical protein